MTVRGLQTREELKIPITADGDKEIEAKRKSGDIVKCVVVRCCETKCVFGHVIPQKGSDEDGFTVNLITGDIGWLGHTKLILKTDQEKSLVSLVSRALLTLRVQVTDLESVTVEHSQAYDSQASGGTEVGVRALRGLYRTLRLCLEKRIGQVVPVQHPLSSWLLEHTALLLNASLRGDDGLTPWARVRGRAFGQRLIGFGESVLYKLPLKCPQHDVHGNMSARALPGVFLGYSRVSNSYRIGLPTGDITESRAVQRLPMENRWRLDALQEVRATPWSLRPKNEGTIIEFGEDVEKYKPEEDGAAPVPRRLKITMDALRTHGFSERCRQCEHIRAFGEAKGGLAHSEACRARIVAAMGDTAAGAARIREADARLDRVLLERVAADDAAAAPAAVQPTAVPPDDETASGVLVSTTTPPPPEPSSGATAGRNPRARGPISSDRKLDKSSALAPSDGDAAGHPRVPPDSAAAVRTSPSRRNPMAGGPISRGILASDEGPRGSAKVPTDQKLDKSSALASPDGDVAGRPRVPLSTVTAARAAPGRRNPAAEGVFPGNLQPPASPSKGSKEGQRGPSRQRLDKSSAPVPPAPAGKLDKSSALTPPPYGMQGPRGASVPRPFVTAGEIARNSAGIDESMDVGVLDDVECVFMLTQMGVDAGAYRRERRTASRRILAEIYSPPRVTRMLSTMPSSCLAPGFALDITCIDPDDGLPWDFDVPAKREKARQLLREEKPLFLIGSPMCTAWCTWQRINALKRDPDVVQRELIKARLHLDFVVSLYREQLETGRYFLHEHPIMAGRIRLKAPGGPRRRQSHSGSVPVRL